MYLTGVLQKLCLEGVLLEIETFALFGLYLPTFIPTIEFYLHHDEVGNFIACLPTVILILKGEGYNLLPK